jgi:hypothetical protein
MVHCLLRHISVVRDRHAGGIHLLHGVHGLGGYQLALMHYARMWRGLPDVAPLLPTLPCLVVCSWVGSSCVAHVVVSGLHACCDDLLPCVPNVSMFQHVPCISSASSLPFIPQANATAFQGITATPDRILLEGEGSLGARPEGAHLALQRTSAEVHSTQAGGLDSLLQRHARRPPQLSARPVAAQDWPCSPALACLACPSCPGE